MAAIVMVVGERPAMNEHVFPKDFFLASVQKIAGWLNTEISPGDAMYAGNAEHYFSVGASALNNILHALAISAAVRTPNRILDFGCGAGRVTRWISAAFPDASPEGCDLREADIAFVHTTFGALTWISSTKVAELNPPCASPEARYDLIWVGSVFTHLSQEASAELFDKLVSWLNPLGVMVFTSHGRMAVSRGQHSGFYGIPGQWDRVQADFETSGFGYADYADTPGYGISLVQLCWWARHITSRAELQLICMTEQAWDGHQDVIAVQKLPSAP
jgi:SAM-dependent methyltransferase